MPGRIATARASATPLTLATGELVYPAILQP